VILCVYYGEHWWGSFRVRTKLVAQGSSIRFPLNFSVLKPQSVKTAGIDNRTRILHL